MRFTKCEADGCNSIHWGQCVSGMSTVCIHVLLCTCGVVHASGTTEGNTFRYTPSSFFPLCWACMNTRVYSIVYNSGPIESYTATVYQSAGKKKNSCRRVRVLQKRGVLRSLLKAFVLWKAQTTIRLSLISGSLVSRFSLCMILLYLQTIQLRVRVYVVLAARIVCQACSRICETCKATDDPDH